MPQKPARGRDQNDLAALALGFHLTGSRAGQTSARKNARGDHPKGTGGTCDQGRLAGNFEH